MKCVRYYIIRQTLLHYQGKILYYIISQNVLHYQAARTLHYQVMLLHNQAVITLIDDYDIISCNSVRMGGGAKRAFLLPGFAPEFIGRIRHNRCCPNFDL